VTNKCHHTDARPEEAPPRAISAFTLLELLVVVALLALFTSMLLPALAKAREAALIAPCQNNLRQVFAANEMYAQDYGHYVAAASDIWSANLQRWHGARRSLSEPFEPERGPLARFLGPSRRVRNCPAFPDPGKGFESGCGGYGYNDRGVGSQAYLYGYGAGGMQRGMKPANVQNPAATVMFCDAAYPQRSGGQTRLIEYSFAEAYRQLTEKPPVSEAEIADPTIHFRHRGRAQVVWCDGHVTGETLTTQKAGPFTRNRLGWFGGPDNTLFDPL
jgi:prepilin-type processing-associated H-X9-DG protein